MRIRTVKPEWLQDEKIASASDQARVLSIGLILMSDDYGNGRAHEQFTASQIWPYESPGKTLKKVSGGLAELSEIGFINLYQVNTQQYFHICNWDKHQKVSHPGKPLVPRYETREKPLKTPIQETLGNVSRDPRETLVPDPDLNQDLNLNQDPDQYPKQKKPDDVREVFDLWKVVHKHPHAQLDDKRKAKIRERLAEGYPQDALCDAIRGARYDDFLMGGNDKGKIYDDLGTILREAKTVDRHLETWEKHKSEEFEKTHKAQLQKAYESCDTATKEHGRDSDEYRTALKALELVTGTGVSASPEAC